MLQVPNPLMTKAEAFSEDLSGYLKEIAMNPDKVNSQRLAQLAHWKQRAKDLMATSQAEIMAIKDEDLRNLYSTSTKRATRIPARCFTVRSSGRWPKRQAPLMSPSLTSSYKECISLARYANQMSGRPNLPRLS